MLTKVIYKSSELCCGPDECSNDNSENNSKNTKEDIAILTLDNPKKLNALSSELVAEINRQIESLRKETKVLILTSSLPKAFVAGVNVQEIHDHSYETAYLGDFMDCSWEVISHLPIPTIAAVSGYALGGGFELALMCDMIVASKSAVFGFPEVNLGIMPGLGGTQFLTRAVGTKIASEILMTGRFISADEALELKLINHVVEEAESTIKKSLEIAKSLAQKSSMSIRHIKEAIKLAQNVGLTQGIKNERRMFWSLFSTKSKQEGTKAFLEKKK